MVRFWSYSGDVGSVRFLPSGDVKSTYISRVKATSPESNHTPPEVKNHSGDVKNRFWLYKEKLSSVQMSGCHILQRSQCVFPALMRGRQ